jgi:hypothetical protein
MLWQLVGAIRAPLKGGQRLLAHIGEAQTTDGRNWRTSSWGAFLRLPEAGYGAGW